MMTPEQRKIRAHDAKALLDNKLFKEALKGVWDYIEGQAISCDMNDKERAHRIIISKQLLAKIERNITRIVEDGKIAEIQIAELEKAKGLRRFIR